MSDFRTTVKIPDSTLEIDHKTPVGMIGSCFTDNIGKRMGRYKFSIDINPFGVVYNPASVGKSLGFLADRAQFNKVDLHYFNNQWFSFYHHTDFSDAAAEKALEKINNRLSRSSEFLRKARALFITIGTAWVFEHKKEGIIVSNNHKLPSNQFHRYRLSTDQVIKHLSLALQKLRKVNPSLRVVFTISPIRHWKDGAVENQLSKSTLVVAVHEIIRQYPYAEYFPAYEIMMDDLRDYRFYDDDMIHLSPTAIQYIWEKFRSVYISQQSERLMRKLEKVVKAFEHRPIKQGSANLKEFAEKTLARIQQLEQQHPFLDFNREKTYFQRILQTKSGV